MKQIILASSSPRRTEIFARTGLAFEVVPSNYEEDNTLAMTPSALVEYLSRQKALDVAKRNPSTVVIGADTLVALDNTVIGKPVDRAQAAEFLHMFSGRSHSVFSGVTVIEGDRVVTVSTETKVYFRTIDDAEVERYLATNEWTDKAGAYALQGKAALFIERVEGDYLTVVGLPLCRLVEVLKEFGITPPYLK